MKRFNTRRAQLFCLCLLLAVAAPSLAAPAQPSPRLGFFLVSPPAGWTRAKPTKEAATGAHMLSYHPQGGPESEPTAVVSFIKNPIPFGNQAERVLLEKQFRDQAAAGKSTSVAAKYISWHKAKALMLKKYQGNDTQYWLLPASQGRIHLVTAIVKGRVKKMPGYLLDLLRRTRLAIR